MIQLAMLVLPGAFHGGVAALLDGFALASERRDRVVLGEGPVNRDMQLTLLSSDGGEVRLDEHVTVQVDRAIASNDRFDFVWVPSFRTGGGSLLAKRLQELRPVVDWLAGLGGSGSLIGASGSAISLLVSAGLVRDFAFPVVPALAPTLREIFPRAKQDDHREIVERGNILLSRGTACDDELVARAFDRVLSPAAGHWLRSVMGQTVESREAVARDPLVESARLWLEQRFTGPVSIAGLAQELSVSQAMLTRRFKAELGRTPSEYVSDLRFTTAKRMLAQSNRSIESIAAAVGYNDARNFREAFRQRAGVSASTWRTDNNYP
ncbi:helix-turn-helix domain-containing protein [Novosphingobium malaysiense]|uniref:HTH araC/xylS-type domain-containing protein n=1 Tax=Novosphingobium malaysiense TaxID=1348853 RepID=A0A0B1ZJ17_9SPHN|nr:helix-turn-helix domain-containing protein [Novosphingobium malaysiense]KHK89156.1 hypothetical protein LK12_21760 [Novosphingobium malaysiense]